MAGRIPPDRRQGAGRWTAGNPPNLLYKLRIWLGLELNAEAAALQDDPKKPAALVSSILKLLDAVVIELVLKWVTTPGR